MSEYVDTKELWTAQEPLEIQNEKFWAKMRVMKDDDGHDYYDVLLGEKGRSAHAHIGYTLMGNMFFNETRDQIGKIHRHVSSQLHDNIPDEKKILNERPPKITLRFQVSLKASSRESKVALFTFLNPENS